MIALFSRRQSPVTRETRSILLLISILVLFVLAPIIEGYKAGELLLLLNLYITLIAATSELVERRVVFRIAAPIAIVSMILLLATRFHPSRWLMLANYAVLAAFLMLVSGSLFAYLGQKGQITRGRILVSVSLYFLLGLTWFALYNLVEQVQPGSFAEQGAPITGFSHWSTMLYFSLVTLSTLGYGDIVPVKPLARMLATLEASTGILYVAITVARLVAAQTTSQEREP